MSSTITQLFIYISNYSSKIKRKKKEKQKDTYTLVHAVVKSGVIPPSQPLRGRQLPGPLPLKKYNALRQGIAVIMQNLCTTQTN